MLKIAPLSAAGRIDYKFYIMSYGSHLPARLLHPIFERLNPEVLPVFSVLVPLYPQSIGF